NRVERQAALAAGAAYVDTVPWFCAATCSPIVERYAVYANRKHVAVGYTRFLEPALTEALALHTPSG
ncbi:MAG TPA: hypothetical protein VMB72_03940, partial [Acidimicrobiales bacterium]|nr:hypothetical protein [Acidimicrobiales bacterium]